MKGYVYIVSNRAYPGLVKIGKARLPRARLKQLSGATGILYPFRMDAYFKSADYTIDEQRAHVELGQYRVNPHKEFFKISVSQAIVELTRLFGEPVYTRDKHRAAIEQHLLQEQERQKQLSQQLEAAQLKRREEIQELKRQRKLSLRRTLIAYSLLAISLVVILSGVRWLCR